MTFKEKHQSFFQRNHALMTPLIMALLSYVGIDGYDKYQQANGGAQQDQTVNINVESVPESMTVDRVRSDTEIQALVDKAVARQRTKHNCEYHGVC